MFDGFIFLAFLFIYFTQQIETFGNEPFVMLDIFYPIREDFIEKLNQRQKEEKDKN